MKQIFTLLTLITLSILSSNAQTVYAVNSNGNYSASCSNCTFNIASGVTPPLLIVQEPATLAGLMVVL